MKNAFLLSTALVAFAGAASAEIAFEGKAAMGVAGGSEIEHQFVSDFDLDATFSGKAAHGLSFGMTVDLADSEDSLAAAPLAAAPADPAYEIFVKGAFGTLTMGEGIDGAMTKSLADAADAGNKGSIGDVEEAAGAGAFAAGDDVFVGQTARWDYALDAVKLSASAEWDEATADDASYAFGAGYDLDMNGVKLGLGAGYQVVEKAGLKTTLTGGSVTAEKDQLVATASYQQWDDGTAEGTHLAVGAGYDFGDLSTHANYRVNEEMGAEVKGYGLTAAYGLGKSAALKAGYGVQDMELETSVWTVGLAMDF
ncbi:porin [Tranquillimonas alkanivorans]|uniref:Outer membrane protein OmpU n=1 Tax=Tranquillimonas alkanivorans TaxID=441119 RepID=A0A1I5WBV7_9RHOB|nr:porin [Tranquillimonas alkanivorans]SFQ17198.1 outer membrane protein OmpU [Tranquillimonas alkanivorans]